MNAAQLCLVLHAHMPFVRHPEHEDFLEEGWLREAILETYIPLLWQLEELFEQGVKYRITLSLSPTLVAMLDDALLRSRFASHLDLLCELAEREVARTQHQPKFNETAHFYRGRFEKARQDYTHRWHQDLAGAFRRLSQAGRVELMTCAATHGYLPLLNQNPLAVRAQLIVAISDHERRFGRRPRGLWLPECGYFPGLDALLHQVGLEYSFVETHAIDHAAGQSEFSIYAPLCAPSGVAFFGRDPDSTRQVWSSSHGYPGDADYREYYRDVGFDLDARYLGAFVHPLGIRRNVGIKYHRVTGNTDQKQPYVRRRALARAAEHARHFLEKRKERGEWLAHQLGRPPLIVAPYDAELFGHWWFEGPEWLGSVLRQASDDRGLGLATPSDYLAAYPKNSVAVPSPSSWGNQGYSQMWLNSSNDWIYPHLHEAAERMVELAETHPRAQGIVKRGLNQAARELLLAQASDWAFIMTQGSVVPYAVKRTKDHLGRFHRLHEMLTRKAIDAAVLADIEALDNPFSELDYRVYREDYEPHWARKPND